MENLGNVLETVREEDFIEYFIFPRETTLDEKEQEEILNTTLKQIQKITSQHLSTYLWHKDSFKLVPRTRTSLLLDNESYEKSLPAHLHGITHYGDNIEDEWFIVWLLQQITKKIDGLTARIIDADGEFLLIEAAEYLPNWATPEVCANRVYFYSGMLHLIEPENPAENKPITVLAAMNEIRARPQSTVASSDIQNCLRNKLHRFPERIEENHHNATAYLPVGVAALLKHKPNLISAAVRAFCNRDVIDMKACRAMKYFPPENRVYRTIKFTKCLYAMITHSKFVPDRRTGWKLPPPNTKEYKAHLLGIKIASGFEILASQAKNGDDNNIEQERGWQNYFKSLEAKGYFNNLLQNSREYNNLLNKAKEYYINYRDSMQCAPAVGQEILELTRSLDYRADELKQEEQSLVQEDDDSWLDISPEELDKMLQEKYGKKKIYTVNGNTNATKFTEKVTKFLDHVSDVDGAEFPSMEDMSLPQRPPRGVKNKNQKSKVQFAPDTKSEETKDSSKIQFDPSSFSCAVQNILNFVIPEDDSFASESDMSEYDDDEETEKIESEKFKSKMEEYMDQMDKELSTTTMGRSFEKKKKTKQNEEDGFDDIESFEPVDIDMNALKNILESYRSQMGEAGPSSNMLGPMGVHLDYNHGDKNSTDQGSD